MARVVCVHGIAKQYDGHAMLLSAWQPALADGLTRAGHDGLLGPADAAMAFYGDLFRPTGQLLTAGDPPYTAADVDEGFEQELLLTWWAGAAAVDPGVVPPGAADTLAAMPHSVQSALRALSGSKFFAGIAARTVIANLKQVRAYLNDPRVRSSIRARVRAAIRPDTRVVVAHSLGSVVAYEVLCELATHRVKALVTLGSPLGIPNLVYDLLDPAPLRKPALAAWPGQGSLTWTNIADRSDVVALVKDLRPRFGDRVRSALVDNGAHAHDATRYLTDMFCGEAVAAGLM